MVGFVSEYKPGGRGGEVPVNTGLESSLYGINGVVACVGVVCGVQDLRSYELVVGVNPKGTRLDHNELGPLIHHFVERKKPLLNTCNAKRDVGRGPIGVVTSAQQRVCGVEKGHPVCGNDGRKAVVDDVGVTAFERRADTPSEVFGTPLHDSVLVVVPHLLGDLEAEREGIVLVTD